MRSGRAPRDARHEATCFRVPVRRAQPGERGNENHAFGRVDLRRELLRIPCVLGGERLLVSSTLENAKRLVVKIGSSLLTQGGDGLDHTALGCRGGLDRLDHPGR